MLAPVFFQFFASAAVIVFAAVLLTKSADKISDITHIGKFLIGSIFLALATSSPELIVDINAIKQGMPDLAIGDLLGSSLFNLLILGIADMASRSQTSMFSRAGAANALAATLSIGLTAIVVLGILLGPQIATFSIGGIGVTSIIILIAYSLGVRMVYFDQKLSPTAVAGSAPKKAPTIDMKQLAKPVLIYLVSCILIIIAAPFMTRAAGDLSRISGLGDTFVGTTLVAFSTSLPELISTIVALRIGSVDLAMGTIFGSNALNMVFFGVLDFFYDKPILSVVTPTHAITGLAVIITTVVAVMGQLYKAEKRIKFIEPDALVVMLLVLSALFGLYFLH